MTSPLAKQLECSPKAQETKVQSEVESCQRLKKWYLMPPCLTLSIIRYKSRVKWSNPEKRVAPFPTPQCGRYWKGSLQIPLDYSNQLLTNIQIITVIVAVRFDSLETMDLCLDLGVGLKKVFWKLSSCLCSESPPPAPISMQTILSKGQHCLAQLDINAIPGIARMRSKAIFDCFKDFNALI